MGSDTDPSLARGRQLDRVRSGGDRPESSRKIGHFLSNLYHMVLRLMGYVAVLLALQYWIGLRPLLGW